MAQYDFPYAAAIAKGLGFDSHSAGSGSNLSREVIRGDCVNRHDDCAKPVRIAERTSPFFLIFFGGIVSKSDFPVREVPSRRNLRTGLRI